MASMDMDHGMMGEMTSSITTSTLRATGTIVSAIISTTSSSSSVLPSSTSKTVHRAEGSTSNSRGGGPHCMIDMLWNWNTIDACFLSDRWHISTSAQFAGSCIGVILLTMSLEFLRRMAKEYDRRIVKEQREKLAAMDEADSTESSPSPPEDRKNSLTVAKRMFSRRGGLDSKGKFRPGLGQQLLRAFLHMSQFAIAYLIMLLAMYYNGFILISIFLGAFLGFFVFGWEAVDLGGGPKEEATLCCG